MFDDQEENQDETAPLSARMRFAYRLAGIDPDNDQALSGLPGRMQRGLTPTTRAIGWAPNWAPRQEPQVPQKLSTGQRMMQRDLDALPSQRANLGAGIAPKLTIGQRMMGIKPDAAFGQRNNAPAGIVPKLTIGQRMMGIGRNGSRIATPQTRQGGFGGFAPTRAAPGDLEITGNRWLGDSRSAFAPGQQAGYSPRPRGNVDMNVQTKPRIGASALRDDWNTISATGNGLERMRNQVRQLDASAGRGFEGSGLDLGSEERVGFAGATKAAAAGAREQQQPPSRSGSPLTGEYVAGPKSQAGDTVRRAADYLKWRNQNFRQATGGGWEAPDGRLYTDEQLRDLYSTQQQEAVWAEQRREQERQATAVANRGTVTITYPDGMIETRTGNHPQRDNNPGDVNYGPFARRHGAIDNDKGSAVFPSADVGWAALDANLRTNKYWDLTIDKVIATYAPKRDKHGKIINNTPKYQANVRAALGVRGDTKLSSLSPEQFELLKRTIAKLEGYDDQRPGQKARVIRELPKRPNVIPRQ